MYDLNYGYNMGPSVASIVWTVLSVVLAIVGGILVYILFLNNKKLKLSGILAWLKNFLNFNTMMLETILKVLYLIATIYVILSSFSLIGTNFLLFLITLVLGPVIIRIIFESSLMFIMIWKNTSDISKNTKK